MRVGVYICHCGINIAATVDVEELTRFAMRLPHVAIARNYTYMCSDPGQDLIKDDIRKLGIDRVVVAACSPRMHESTYRKALRSAGLNPFFFEMANIREQCSWVHANKEEGTKKAMDVVASAIAKVSLHDPLEETEVGVTPSVLVIGGGIAGIQACLDIARSGFEVYLVEKSPSLGGNLAQIDQTFPTLENTSSILLPRIAAIEAHPLVHVFTRSEVGDVEGFVGNFKVRIDQEGGGQFHAEVGSIIVATGYDLFDPLLKPELGYGRYPNVMTTMEFERLLSPTGPTGGRIVTGGEEPGSVVFVQCVGSRDKTVGNEYCSRVCCMVTAKQAHLVKERIPHARVTVCYIDIRAFGKGCEQFYEQVQKKGVFYRKGVPSEIYQRSGKLIVRADDELLGEPYEEAADLVVLATGLTQRRDAGALRSLLKLSQGPDRFYLEIHPKLRPLDTAMEGIFLAGTCQGPKDIADTLSQAHGAASRATTPLFAERVKIEPITAAVDRLMCAGCGLCEQVCEYRALKIDPYRQVMTVNEALCKGCGACNATCPSSAISLRHFKTEQIIAQIRELC